MSLLSITDMDELKEQSRTECAKLNHVVIVALASIRQWHCR